MTHILVTNDDGIHAPGLFALVQAMRAFGDVEVAAPAVNQSASGHKKTLFHDIPVTDTTLKDGTPALSVGGSPADCVAVVSLGLARHWPPDIVVSGINRGANMGQDITYSGTVTAALEAAIDGVKAVAVSLDHPQANEVEDYAEAARVAQRVVEAALTHPFPPLTILNVNVPNVRRVKGIRLVRQGVRIYNDQLARNADNTAYRIVGPAPGGVYDTLGTDVWALHQGYASVTPIHLDMTHHQFMAELAAWDISVD